MGYYIETLIAFQYDDKARDILNTEENRQLIAGLTGKAVTDEITDLLLFTEYEGETIAYIQFYVKSSSLDYRKINGIVSDIWDKQTDEKDMPYWHHIEIGEDFDHTEDDGNLYDIFSISREIKINK